MTTLLKSAKIIDTTSPYHLQVKDILISKGTIIAIEDTIAEQDDYQVLNLNDLHVSPGWFDSSVCFGDPGYEERETIEHGIDVAAKSGFTAVAVNPYTQPITETKAAISYWLTQAQGAATTLYPIGALTQKSEGVEMAELFDMKQAGAIAFGDYKRPITNDNLLKIALLYAQNFDGLIQSFPKNKHIAGEGVAHEGYNSTKLGLKGIPALAEELQVARDLFLLEYTGGKLHIPTISTKKSVALIRDAKARGLDVSCSVAVHNLSLTDDELCEFEATKKVNPPLRTSADTEALIEGVQDGTIDMITTDHNPIDIEYKKVEFSIAKDGTIGLESAFGVLNSLFDLETIVRSLSTQPRKRFGLDAVSIVENAEANLSLFSPEGSYEFTEKNVLSTSKNSAFYHKTLRGTVYGIYANEQLVVK
ncbi:Dihydroorotase [Tenacibaculum litopenaei]|jgi:dihydroorotase|uniref:dihydroorotase n=1 Tax=Tenacibaculum litopenaei TaxID=396016 RepID=UPI0038954668